MMTSIISDLILFLLFYFIGGIFVASLIWLCTLGIIKATGGSVKSTEGKWQISNSSLAGGSILGLLIFCGIVFAGNSLFGDTWWWKKLIYFGEIVKELPSSG